MLRHSSLPVVVIIVIVTLGDVMMIPYWSGFL